LKVVILPTTAYHPSTAATAGCILCITALKKMTTEFVGNWKFQHDYLTNSFSLPLAGKRRALPMKQTPHREETPEIKTTTAMSFSHGSGLLFLKDKHSKLSFFVDSGPL
jgi:hypothetical protein